MAVPKNKTSHARKSSRRSTVWKINAPELTACPNCGELTAAHKLAQTVVCTTADRLL